MLLVLIILTVCVISDFLTKMLAYHVFRLEEVSVIKHVLYFTYLENRGAAFGILQNHRWIFIAVTIVAMLAILGYIIWKKPKDRMLLVSLALILGGGIGNLIDRIRLSYVIDFIDFRLIHFPVFNIADICVVCGCILLCIDILFFDRKNGETEHGNNHSGKDNETR